MHLPCKPCAAGFTLVELIVVIVIVGIMAVFAAEKMYSPAEMSLPSQAQKMARDIDSAKTLAYTSGKRMSLTITEGANGTYAVTCVTAPTPCDTDFSVTLQKGVVLAVVSPTPNPLQFSSLGQPSAAASYTLISGSTETISVAALTGAVTVSP